MFSLRVLGSGSAGNAMLIQSDSTALLVDAGLSAKQLVARLKQCDVDPFALKGVLLTHEHSDHTGGLRVFCTKYEIPCYCNSLTAEALKSELTRVLCRVFRNGTEFTIGDIRVRPFSVPHDAADPLGFCLAHDDVLFGVLTDLGHAPGLVLESLRGIHGLLIETNHDEALLHQDIKRPWAIKQRILSRHGHLSNASAAHVVRQLLDSSPLEHVILGHLSKDCNRPELATQRVDEELKAAGHSSTKISCATQEAITETIMLGASSGTFPS
ncbi:MAG: metal-dependent hydrolase [Verrucomicrobia bacterium]|nr:MAG: metal-dependent hydrolase [Verrucomicrobiota bacterium]